MPIENPNGMETRFQANRPRDDGSIVIEIVINHVRIMQPHLRSGIGLKVKCIFAVRRNLEQSAKFDPGEFLRCQGSDIECGGAAGMRRLERVEIGHPRPLP